MVRRASSRSLVVLFIAGLASSSAPCAHADTKTLQWKLFSGASARMTLSFTAEELAEARSARFPTYGQYVRFGIAGMQAVVERLRDSVRPRDQGELVEGIAALAQSIEFEERKGQHAPLETLERWKGDCEEKSILAAALLEAAGIRTVLLAFPKARHMAVGAALAREGQWVVDHEGTRYTYIEVTGYGWRPGRVPEDIEGHQARVVRIPAAAGPAIAAPSRDSGQSGTTDCAPRPAAPGRAPQSAETLGQP